MSIAGSLAFKAREATILNKSKERPRTYNVLPHGANVLNDSHRISLFKLDATLCWH